MHNGWHAGDPMDHSHEMLRYLEAVDVDGMRRLWAAVRPEFPSHDDVGMVIAIHLCRTQCEPLRFRYRAYSHKWLIERGYPSLLPDELRPKAHRIYPVTKHAVGIAVRSKYPEVKITVTGAMSNAVLEAEANGRLIDGPYVRGRMLEARSYALRKLFGKQQEN